MPTEIKQISSSLFLGWVVQDEAGTVLEGPFLTQTEAIRADERLRIAGLIQNRRDRLMSYVPEDLDDPNRTETSDLIEVLAKGVEMAIEIARLGACPACVGSAHDVPGNVCRTCGVDYTDYSMPKARAPRSRSKR